MAAPESKWVSEKGASYCIILEGYILQVKFNRHPGPICLATACKQSIFPFRNR